MRTPSFALLLVLLAPASCGTDKFIPPKQPVIGDEIVFFGRASDDTTFAHLFVINADGTGLHQLTTDSLNDAYPRWSPDGMRIVFVRRYGPTGDSAEVTVANSDGTNIVRLTYDQYLDYGPSWSPDGTQIAYERYEVLVSEVWVVNADGSNPHLFMSADSTNSAQDITWTKQNTLLGADTYGIDLQLTPTATSLTRILDLFPVSGAQPRLSPDGNTIAFAWEGPYADEGPFIYTVSTDGSNMQRITNVNDRAPVWSPDGTRIAFIRDSRIWIMNADGTNQRQITATASVRAIYLGDWK